MFQDLKHLRTSEPSKFIFSSFAEFAVNSSPKAWRVEILDFASAAWDFASAAWEGVASVGVCANLP